MVDVHNNNCVPVRDCDTGLNKSLYVRKNLCKIYLLTNSAAQIAMNIDRTQLFQLVIEFRAIL